MQSSSYKIYTKTTWNSIYRIKGGYNNFLSFKIIYTMDKSPKFSTQTQTVILVFVCLGFIFLYLLALDQTHYFQAQRNCDSIYRNLESINTEATPERLDLENAYFQLGCK